MGERAFSGEDDEYDTVRLPKNSPTPFLDTFGKDLTQLARLGKLDPVIGREEEIELVIQILNKRRSNNPMLVGESGVGKCICSDTKVVVKNDTTGEIKEMSIRDVLSTFSNSTL